MIDDARQVPAGTRLQAGVCIVGGGPAGITIARELAGSRHDVVLLESGGFELRPDVQDLYRGTSSGIPYDVGSSRLRFLGGSTNHWGGWCRPLDEIDFEARPWIPRSGWPFGRRELDPYYERAQEVCELGPYRYESRWWRRRLPDVVPLLDTATIRTDFFQVGPAIHFGRRYRADLRRARNVRVLLYANAVNVRVDGRRVAGVDVATLDGSRFAVDADVVVLAAGGIENARLLLASRDQFRDGVGNERGLVGRYFMEHPHFLGGRCVLSRRAPDASLHLALFPPGVPFSVAGVLDRDNMRSLLGALALTPAASRALRMPRFTTTIGFSRPLGADAGIGERDVDGLLAGIEGVAQPDRPGTGALLTLNMTAEVVPNPHSRVTLGGELDALGVPRVDLHWALTDDDWTAIDAAPVILANQLGRRGLGRVQRVSTDEREREFRGGGHHMGTTRMHRDPGYGVVDEQCEVHGVAKLYVAGSSVFPTAGVVNPTLTIVALALRLAARIRDGRR